MSRWVALFFYAVLAVVVVVVGKVYERCELARELRDVHDFPEDQVATWVCIARHESEFNTSAVGHANGDGSGDHGLFQISDIYWCSPPGKGWACGVTCAELEDDDISDDVACVKRIFRQHQKLAGNGFTAWAVYSPFCSNVHAVDKFVEGCYDNVTTTSTTGATSKTGKKPLTGNEVVKDSGGRKFRFWS
ncbi:hypothetical protein C0J52_10258 [Blattella germanica]|nr:hypothetical protein C0J52_10258 [Blattella germanica]